MDRPFSHTHTTFGRIAIARVRGQGDLSVAVHFGTSKLNAFGGLFLGSAGHSTWWRSGIRARVTPACHGRGDRQALAIRYASLVSHTRKQTQKWSSPFVSLADVGDPAVVHCFRAVLGCSKDCLAAATRGTNEPSLYRSKSTVDISAILTG